MTEPFGGVIGRYHDESTPWWPAGAPRPAGAPNVLLVVLDDVGFAQLGCFGSDIDTPVLDGLAAQRACATRTSTPPRCARRRAPACSPGATTTRTGWGASSSWRRASPATTHAFRAGNGFLSEMLVAARLCRVRGRQVAPHAGGRVPSRARRARAGRSAAASSASTASSAARRTSSRPRWCTTTTRSTPPRIDRRRAITSPRTWSTAASSSSRDLRAVDATKPFFLYFCTGACHSPHQAPRRMDRALPRPFRSRLGRVARRETLGAPDRVRPAAGRTSSCRRDRSGCPAWDALSADEQRVYARYMEALRRLPQPHRRSARPPARRSSTTPAISTTRW